MRIGRSSSARGGAGPFTNAGAPSNGTTEVQTVTETGTPAGGTFRLSFRGFETANIAQAATAATVQTALRALPTIGSGGCSVTGSAGGPYTVTFSGALAAHALPLLTLSRNNLTGGTNPSVTIVHATTGVDATGIGAAAGALIQDTTNGQLWQNIGSANVPSWVPPVGLVEVTLTNAQIKALRATPVTLVAAPGAGRMLEFLGAILLLKAGANVLTESTANLGIKYTDGAGVQVSQAIESTGFIDQAADTLTNARPAIDAIVAKAGADNKPLVLHNLGAGEIAGNAAADATLKVRLAYRVWSTT